MDTYILEGHEVKPATTEEWGRWTETENRRVARTEVGSKLVSTVFLGMDHSFGEGPPALFETMVFPSGDHEEDCLRYSTWAEAELGHMETVERLQAEVLASNR